MSTKEGCSQAQINFTPPWRIKLWTRPGKQWRQQSHLCNTAPSVSGSSSNAAENSWEEARAQTARRLASNLEAVSKDLKDKNMSFNVHRMMCIL